jgi:YidC/Oxa1 family membrane protein insertase
MEKRAILAIVLSLIVVIGFNILYPRTQPTAPVPATQKQQESAKALPQEGKKGISSESITRNVEPSALKSIEAEKNICVETPLYSAVFSTKGAVLKSFKLKKYRQSLTNKTELVELVNINGLTNYPLAINFAEANSNLPADITYKSDIESLNLSSGGTGRLIFTVNTPGQLKVEKIFTFYADKYAFDLNVKVRNLSQVNIEPTAVLFWTHYFDPKAEEDSYSHNGPVFFVKNEITTETPKDLEARKVIGPDVSWGGYESKYFLMSLIPKQPTLTNLVFGKDQRNLVSVAMDGPKSLIPSGQDGTFSYSVYLGPKDYDILKAQKVGLENSIDYGWVKWLALPLLITMKFLYQFVHNYGIAIIILTIFIKVIFWPLGNKSYKSMKEMQSLQPKITELREKYKNDKARLNQEVMQLYKKYKINPLSGCLPMLIQIPVFFGLYKALLYSIELRHSPFVWWIQDLSAKDPYYITPIIMGATMLWQQKISPQAGDPMQAKLMMLMPVVFTFLFLNFPSGLVIYWLFNNILSIGQQYYINKRF